MQIAATSTPDRLAKPTLPAAPSQADLGAQVYWLSCLPCHGDLGQGLTDEFRAVYPPDDRNCWKWGCHGEHPYDNGFKLPASIPAVVSADALQKFPNAAVLQAYIKAAMPYWKPGSLTDEDAWAVTAFLLRENGLRGDRAELNASNADSVHILRLTPIPPSQQEQPQVQERSAAVFPKTLLVAGIAFAAFLFWFVLKKRPNKVVN